MATYENYKDSGIEWLGEIPEHWEVKKIKHNCTVKARVGWKGLKSSDFLQKGYAYLVTGSDFNTNKIDWEKSYHIDQKRYEEDPYIQLKNNDLLITKDGTIGKLAIVENLDKPACLNSGIFVIRSFDKKLSTKYLYWILFSDVFKKFNAYTSYGSTIQHLYQNVFVDFPYTLPSTEEQSQIAEYLDKKTTEIDDLINQKEHLLQLYEEEKEAIINQAVTKGVNPNAKLKDSGIEWIGEIPEHWEVKKMKYLGDFINGYSFKSNDFQTFGVRVLKISNIQHMNIDWSDSSYVSKELYDKKINFRIFNDDLVFALTRPIISTGIKVALIKSEEKILLNQRNSVFRSNTIKTEWIYYMLLSKRFIQEFDKRIDKTGQQPNISSNDIGDIHIPIPKLKECEKITKNIKYSLTQIEIKSEKTTKLITLLKEYKTALISEVVTGKLKVI